MSGEVFRTVLPVYPGGCDHTGLARPSALQSLFITAALRHLDSVGASREDVLRACGGIWVLVRCSLDILAPIAGDDVEVVTWGAAAKGVGFPREAELTVGGRPAARVSSLWGLVDAETHRLLRPSALTDVLRFPVLDAPRFETPHRIRRAALSPAPYLHTVRYSDLDMNGHLHSARYADLCCDALALEQERSRVRSFGISYVAECLPGETIAVHCERSENTALVLGIGSDGKNRFEARLILENFDY